MSTTISIHANHNHYSAKAAEEETVTIGGLIEALQDFAEQYGDGTPVVFREVGRGAVWNSISARVSEIEEDGDEW